MKKTEAKCTRISMPLPAPQDITGSLPLERPMHCSPPDRGEDMAYQFGDLRAEIEDDWEDEIATLPTNRWVVPDKVFTPFVYATTDMAGAL